MYTISIPRLLFGVVPSRRFWIHTSSPCGSQIRVTEYSWFFSTLHYKHFSITSMLEDIVFNGCAITSQMAVQIFVQPLF